MHDTVVRRSGTSAVALRATGTAVRLADLQLVDNVEHGLLANDGRVAPFTADRLTVTGNGGHPAVMAPETVAMLSDTSSFTGNGDDRITMRSSVASYALDESLVWHDLGVPYVVGMPVHTAGPTAAVLTIEAGTEIQFDERGELASGLGGLGALELLGTAAEPIVLTSAESAPAPGDWIGVLASSQDSGSIYDHVEIRYAGGDPSTGGPSLTGAFAGFVCPADVTFDSVLVADSLSAGVHLSGGCDVLGIGSTTYSGNAGGDLVVVP